MPDSDTLDDELRSLVKSRIVERFVPIHFVVTAEGAEVHAYCHNDEILRRLCNCEHQPDSSLTPDDLSAEIRQALDEARWSGHSIVRDDVPLKNDAPFPRITVIVEPLPRSGDEPLFLIMLDRRRAEDTTLASKHGQRRRSEWMAEPHARQLGEMREQIHRHPTVNERLLDRLKSPYEKLHLARQELANTRQMLQVLNRQLSIANTELGSKISELGSGPIDEATGPRPTAILLLDRSLILRSFSSTAHSPLTLSPADNGTSVEDHLRRLPDADALLQEIHEVATSGVSRDREVHDNKNGVRYRVQILPHRDAKGLLDGSLVVFLDM